MAKLHQEYLSLGIADAVITRLASTGQIAVRPTSSVVKYTQAPNVDLLTIGREQQVDAILEGSVEMMSDRIRVSAQLVRVRDGFVLWADSFKTSRGEMFALEEKVAEGVEASVPLRLSQQAKIQQAHSETENLQAYELYLQGRYYWNKRTKEDLHRSIQYFQQAIAADPNYALAYASLANAYVVSSAYGEAPWQVYPKAKVAALKAVELDSSLAAAHASLAMVAAHYEWNWNEAEKEFLRSIELNANDSAVRVWYATHLAAMGRHDEALTQAQRAQDLDPMSPVVNTTASRILYWSRKYDRAIDGYEKVILSNPKFAGAHTRCGVVYLAKRDLNNAIREFEAAEQISGADPYLDGLMGYAQALSGHTQAARKLLKKLTLQSHDQYVPAFSVALVYIGLGDRESALEWLEKSYQDRSSYMVYAKTDALLDPIRSEPRFATLLRRMGLS